MSLSGYIFTNLTLEQLKAVEDCFGDNEGKAIAWVGHRRPYRGGCGVFFTKSDWKTLRNGSALLEKIPSNSGRLDRCCFDKRTDKKKVLKKTSVLNFRYGYSRNRATLHGIFATVTVDGVSYSIKNFENIPLVLKPGVTTFFTLRAKRGNTRIRGVIETSYTPTGPVDGLMSSLVVMLDRRKELKAKGLLPLF